MTRALSNMHAEEIDWRFQGEQQTVPFSAPRPICERCRRKAQVIAFIGPKLRRAIAENRRLEAALTDIHRIAGLHIH